MLRLALALLLSLYALPAVAQTDPRTNGGGSAPNVTPPSSGTLSGNERITGRVLVGEHAPDFSLAVAGGGQFRLKETRGHWTALFFTDRREDLPHMAGLAATLDSLKFTTVVVLDEKVQALAQWRASSHAPLAAVADEHGEIAALYGLWDTEHGSTRPGLFVLDPNGVVKLELLGQKVGAPSLRGLVQTAVEGL